MQKEELLDCYRRIQPYIHRTPVMTSGLLNQITGAHIYFKCENFQKMGAYKIRGATNAILQLTPAQRSLGVVTHSSGNFAQALSLAGQSLQVKAYIVMPSSAPAVKKEAVKAYGGVVHECEPTLKARTEMSELLVKQLGATFIHPSNDPEVIIGQGTACLELLQDHPDLHTVIVPVGGGGLIAGTALAAHSFGRACEVVGGEPFEADDAYRSLQSGKIEANLTTHTIADGLKTELGTNNFPIIKAHVQHIIRVTEAEIVSAMRLLWERMKIVVEPSSAVALAALIREKEQFAGKKVGIILSGGNVDLSQLPF